MTALNLDELEQVARHEGAGVVLELIAELRVARRLVDLERPRRPHCSAWCPCERNQAWLAYEQAMWS